MMMQRVSDADLVFEKVGLWIYTEDAHLDRTQVAITDKCALISRAKMEALPRVLGVDMAYTGSERDTKNRSKTGFDVTAIDPETKIKYVLFSFEDFIKPGHHEEIILRLCAEWKVTLVAIELDKAVHELVESLQAKGLTVVTYSPAKLGSKENRKQPVAGWFNTGMAFVHGWATVSENEWKTLPIGPHIRIRGYCLAFPAACPDELDALEIAMRTAEQYWGGPVSLDVQGSAPDNADAELERFVAMLNSGTVAVGSGELTPETLADAMAEAERLDVLGEET
jgi:hypothetical protein